MEEEIICNRWKDLADTKRRKSAMVFPMIAVTYFLFPRESTVISLLDQELSSLSTAIGKLFLIQ